MDQYMEMTQGSSDTERLQIVQSLRLQLKENHGVLLVYNLNKFFGSLALLLQEDCTEISFETLKFIYEIIPVSFLS